ncbi:MAG: hypothetical protein Fur005_49400 [Roseiflexaceae bacterium]
MAATLSSTTPSVAFRKIPVAALIGGGIGAIVNLIILFATRAIGITTWVVTPQSPDPVPVPEIAVLMASFMPSIFAGIVYAIMARFLKQPARIFQIIAVVLAVLSLGSVIPLPVDSTSKVILSIMHFVAAGAITWSLTTRTTN